MLPEAVGRFRVGIGPLPPCPGQATAQPERRSGTQEKWDAQSASRKILYTGSRVSLRSPGTRGCGTAARSHLQRGNVDPTPLLPALVGGLDQLQALGALQQRPLERRVFIEMPDEH